MLGLDLLRRFASDEIFVLERDAPQHLGLDLVRAIVAGPLDIEAVEIDHSLEISLGAPTLDDDPGELAAFSNQRRGGRAEAAAHDDDAVGVDPGVTRKLVERLA